MTEMIEATQTDGHDEVLMEAYHVSDAIIEMGPLTEKSKIAANAIYIIGSQFPGHCVAVAGQNSTPGGLEKQLTNAARRAVAADVIGQDEVKQTIAHLTSVFGRIRTEKSGVDDLFESVTSESESEVDVLFDAVLSEVKLADLSEKKLRTLIWRMFGNDARSGKAGNKTREVFMTGQAAKTMGVKRYTSMNIDTMSREKLAKLALAVGAIRPKTEDLLSEGYAKAGEIPDWGEMEAVFDKLMMDQDLSKEELVNVGAYIDAVVSSARGPWQNAPAPLPEPAKVVAGPVAEETRRGKAVAETELGVGSVLQDTTGSRFKVIGRYSRGALSGYRGEALGGSKLVKTGTIYSVPYTRVDKVISRVGKRAAPMREGLDEGFNRPRARAKQKAEWMRKFQKVAQQSGAKKINWDDAHHYFFQGLGAEDAGMRYGKTHIKDVA